MLSTMRRSWLLFSLVALFTLSSALSIEEALHLDGIEAYLHNGVKRQAQGTGNSQSSSPSPTSASPAPSSSPEQSSTPTTQTTSSPTETSETSPTDNSTPQSTQPTTTNQGATTTSSSSSRATTPVVKTSPLVSTSVQRYTTVFSTVSNGQTILQSSTGERSSLITTGQSVTTELPSPQDGDSKSKGLSDDNKKVIGGVVGGVGGAILLGGIALVCWRIWGKKKRVTEDDADLMAGTGSALGDKPANGRSPFESNLEQYHNPGGRPNAAANF